MQTKEIDDRISELKAELAGVSGTRTEVYTRIVGYYRSVRNWNAGKREEYGHRKLFRLPAEAALPESSSCQAAGDGASVLTEMASPVSYLLFTRQTCPNCPPVKSYVDGLEMKGDNVDVDTEEGLAAARRYGVMASPTVIFLDQSQKEVFRANNLGELKSRISSRA